MFIKSHGYCFQLFVFGDRLGQPSLLSPTQAQIDASTNHSRMRTGRQSNSECGDFKQQIQIIMEGQIAKFIIPMLKNQTVNPNPHHLFLVKINPAPHDLLLDVNFQPTIKPNHLEESIMPRFNQDRQHFTPAFLLPRDERFYRQNITFEKIKFDEQIQNAEEKSITYDLNRLSPPSSYCQLCKTSYQNYLEHTSSNSHLERLTTSQANRFIEELVFKFKSKNRCRRVIAKTKDRVKAQKTAIESFEVKLSGTKSTRRKAQATSCRTSNQSTNVVEETIRASNY